MLRALLLCSYLLLASCAHSVVAEKSSKADEVVSRAGEESIPVDFKSSENDETARILFVKLGVVDHAETYEVQIRQAKNRTDKPHSILTGRDNLRLRVVPGVYEIRTRSIAASTARGGWGEWRAVTVPFRQPVDVYPKADSTIIAKGNTAERLSFEWPKSPAAKAYRFKLYDLNKVLLRNVVTSKNWNLETLDIDRSYLWSVQPLSSLDEKEAPDFETTLQFTLSQPVNELISVEFKLPVNPRAVQYQFEYVRMISDTEKSEPTIFETREAKFKARLEPGHYEYRGRSIFENGTFGEWGLKSKILIPITRPVVIEPVKDQFIDPTDDSESEVRLTWQESKWAASYEVSVYSGGTLVSSIDTKENYAIFRLPHAKSYQWLVSARLATSKGRAPATTYEADGQEGSFTIGEYIKLNLGGSEEPSQLYAWTRFVYSKVNYLSDNYDQNSRINEAVLASSLEIAGGYWYRKTNYGGLVTAQISGIDIGGVTATYKQYGALLGYRMSFSGQKRMRVWLGPSLKETPEMIPDGVSRGINIQLIKTLGASALVAYFDAFTESVGMQLYTGSFYGYKGLDTPNGLGQKSYISFFASAYATYKFSKTLTSLFGYTFQSDTAGYASADRSGNDNLVRFAGHYLSLSFIFGLQEPQK